MTKLTKFDSIDILMKTLSSYVSNDLRESLKNNKVVTLSVPGGTTPAPFFDYLCNEDLEWQRVNVLLSDERYLPEDNIRSNARLIAKHLIQKKASVARMVSFYNKNLSEEEFVIKYESQMSTLLPISVSILGMGEDMHTASLFPDSDELLDKTYILILGENKLNAYKKACSEKTEINAPIRVVFGSNTSVFWADKI